MLLVAVIDQCVKAIDRLGDNVAAVAAIAAVRTAEFDELLAPERDAAIAAVAGANVNLGLVEKLHCSTLLKRETQQHNCHCGEQRRVGRQCPPDIRSGSARALPGLR